MGWYAQKVLDLLDIVTDSLLRRPRINFPDALDRLWKPSSNWEFTEWEMITQRPLASLSVVVPVYRSEAILPELVRRLEGTLSAIASSYEIVLINDSSPDASWDVICQLAQRYPWIHPINLMRNYGQHNALLCGIRAAQYGVIVTMDDDLQHPPEEIAKLLAILEQGADVVY